MLASPKLKIKESVRTGGKTLRSLLISAFNIFYERAFFGLLKRVDRKFIKFLFVGILNTAFGYLMYALFVSLSFTPGRALLASYILGIFWNFKTTGTIVFKNKDNSLIFKFFLTYILTFLVNKTCLEFLVYYAHINKYLAEAIVIPPVAILTFIIFKTYVFIEKKS